MHMYDAPFGTHMGCCQVPRLLFSCVPYYVWCTSCIIWFDVLRSGLHVILNWKAWRTSLRAVKYILSKHNILMWIILNRITFSLNHKYDTQGNRKKNIYICLPLVDLKCAKSIATYTCRDYIYYHFDNLSQKYNDNNDSIKRNKIRSSCNWSYSIYCKIMIQDSEQVKRELDLFLNSRI